MSKKTTLIDRIRNAINAFRAKPIGSISYGVEVKRCSECEHIVVIYNAYKDLVDFHHNDKDIDFDLIIGYLGEVLDD